MQTLHQRKLWLARMDNTAPQRACIIFYHPPCSRQLLHLQNTVTVNTVNWSPPSLTAKMRSRHANRLFVECEVPKYILELNSSTIVWPLCHANDWQVSSTWQQASKEPTMHKVTDELWQSHCALFPLPRYWVSAACQAEWKQQDSREATRGKKKRKHSQANRIQTQHSKPQQDQSQHVQRIPLPLLGTIMRNTGVSCLWIRVSPIYGITQRSSGHVPYGHFACICRDCQASGNIHSPPSSASIIPV